MTKRNSLSHVLLLLVSLYISPLFSSDIQTFILKPKMTGIPLGKFISFYEDKGKQLKIEDVSKPEFKSNFNISQMDALGFGFKDSAFWFVFQVKNELQTEIDWIMEIGYPMLDRMELYIPNTNGFD